MRVDHDYYIVQKLDYLTCSKFVIKMSLYKPIELVKLKLFSALNCNVMHYIPDGLAFQLYNIL